MSARDDAAELPALRVAQAQALDRRLQAQLRVPSLLLMENAGRGAADVVAARFGAAHAAAPRAVVLLGAGNNGGDGAVVARHLARLGWSVRCFTLGAAARRTPDCATNLAIVCRLGLPVAALASPAAARRAALGVARDEVVVDALVGLGARGPLREPMAALVAALEHAHPRATVALDLPSGLDADRGVPAGPTVRADLTLTFAARKTGFAAASAAPFLGEVVVVDLGVPVAAAAALTRPGAAPVSGRATPDGRARSGARGRRRR